MRANISALTRTDSTHVLRSRRCLDEEEKPREARKKPREARKVTWFPDIL